MIDKESALDVIRELNIYDEKLSREEAAAFRAVPAEIWERINSGELNVKCAELTRWDAIQELHDDVTELRDKIGNIIDEMNGSNQ